MRRCRRVIKQELGKKSEIAQKARAVLVLPTEKIRKK